MALTAFYPLRVDQVATGDDDHSPGGVPASPVEIVLRNGRRMIVRSDIAPVALGHLLDVVDR